MILTHKAGRGKKIHLFIDDEYKITTDVEFWADNYIKDNTELNEDEWNELQDAINYKKAINKCADLLSRRDHSVKELRDKLLRTVDPVNSERAINHFIELGYLDDEKFAKMLIPYLLNTKKFSINHIKQECFKRGIDKDIVYSILEDTEIDNVSTIIDIISSKYEKKLQLENGREKVVGALMRKGFTYADIKSALYRLESE